MLPPSSERFSFPSPIPLSPTYSTLSRKASTCSTSLSPWPERHTSSAASLNNVGATLTAYAKAWEDPSAGMMPSVRDSRKDASTAPLSVTLTYSARPMFSR